MQPDRRTEHARRIAAMRREMDERERNDLVDWTDVLEGRPDSYVGSC